MKKTFIAIATVLLCHFTILKAQTVVINEFMADNSETIPDPSGSYDDWIEIFNVGNEPVDIGGLYITDDFAEPTKYQIPQGNDSTIIQPQGFLLLWADEDMEQGVLHIDIKLSKSGEEIALFKPDGSTIIDSVSFGGQSTDVSYGRQPNGASTWVFFNDPTPGWSNGTTGISFNHHDLFTLTPNPTQKMTTLYFPFEGEKIVKVCDMNGKLVIDQKVSGRNFAVNCDSFLKGFYIVSVVGESNILQKSKLIVE